MTSFIDVLHEICRPHDIGGAGIRDLSNMNLSFLSKFVWRILTHLAYYQELFEPNMTEIEVGSMLR